MLPPSPRFPARAARETARLPLTVAAHRARLTVEYLARMERTGRFPLHIAERLARLYGASLNDFLPPGGSGTPSERRAGGCRCPRPRREPDFIRPEDIGTTAEERAAEGHDDPSGHDGEPVIDPRDLDGFEPHERSGGDS